MLYAMKNNRQTKITEDEKERFINQGYRIAKEVKGKLEFEEAETEEAKEIEELKAENSAIKEENEALKAELEALKVANKKDKKEEGK